MKKSSRSNALEILYQWQESKTSIDLLVDKNTLGMSDVRDRQLVKAIVFGVLRQLGVIDWVLAKLCNQPLRKVKALALQALRIGVFQILFMDRVPSSAAINETVEALKMKKQPRWMTGFVNGVLRNVDRQKEKFVEMIITGTFPDQAFINHPLWLVARWKGRYGDARAKEFCLSNAVPAQLCLRINTLQTTVENYLAQLEDQVSFSRCAYVGEALSWDATGPINNLPGYSEGLFSVQDEIAQLLCYLLAPFEAGVYLDACAGLGGKTAVLAQLLAAQSRLFAVEPDRRRQQLFTENMERLGIDNVSLFAGELADFVKEELRKFQGVLLDVPCSGLGVTGRHPDIRWNRQPEDLKRFQARQLDLLYQAAPLVDNGGVLVYATCSTEPEENEEVIAKFLESHADYILENAKDYLPSNAAELVSEKGFLQTIPGEQISDGFFGARLKKI